MTQSPTHVGRTIRIRRHALASVAIDRFTGTILGQAWAAWKNDQTTRAGRDMSYCGGNN